MGIKRIILFIFIITNWANQTVGAEEGKSRALIPYQSPDVILNRYKKASKRIIHTPLIKPYEMQIPVNQIKNNISNYNEILLDNLSNVEMNQIIFNSLMDYLDAQEGAGVNLEDQNAEFDEKIKSKRAEIRSLYPNLNVIRTAQQAMVTPVTATWFARLKTQTSSWFTSLKNWWNRR